jgi:uncharacterized protein DUF2867
MKAKRRDMPSSCAFGSARGTLYYWDSFEVPLRRIELSITDIYLGVFAHHPSWMKWFIVIRGKIVRVFGLRATTLAELSNIEIKKKYALGDRIARFTLFAQNENEIVTGGDDTHLDFRVSVQRLNEGGTNKVVLTTVVRPHNLLGKAYLFFILPFHRFGVSRLLANAAAANRV